MAHADPNAGTLTWLGHSCAAIRLDGIAILTDPVLRSRVIHLRRKEPVAPGAVDGVDVVLISHSHYDHLDLPSLDRLDRGAQVLVPAGAGDLLRRRGFRFVREVTAGDEVDVGAVRVRVTHAEHASGFRVGTGKTQPVGYVIAGSPHRLLRGRHRPLPGDGRSGADRRGTPARRRLGPSPTGRPSRSGPRRRGARVDPAAPRDPDSLGHVCALAAAAGRRHAGQGVRRARRERRPRRGRTRPAARAVVPARLPPDPGGSQCAGRNEVDRNP